MSDTRTNPYAAARDALNAAEAEVVRLGDVNREDPSPANADALHAQHYVADAARRRFAEVKADPSSWSPVR